MKKLLLISIYRSVLCVLKFKKIVNMKKMFIVIGVAIVSSLSAHGQLQPSNSLDSLQKITILKERKRQDSLLRIMMKDSLNLNNQAITRLFLTKENFTSQSDQIRKNITLSPNQKADALQAVLIETDKIFKELMGSLL